jgi:hypothetical protein
MSAAGHWMQSIDIDAALQHSLTAVRAAGSSERTCSPVSLAAPSAAAEECSSLLKSPDAD